LVDQLKKTIEEMSVNNEKTIQTIIEKNETELSELQKKYAEEILLHTDANKKTEEVQAQEIAKQNEALSVAEQKMKQMLEKIAELESLISENPPDPDLLKKIEMEKLLKKQIEEYEISMNKVKLLEQEKMNLEEELKKSRQQSELDSEKLEKLESEKRELTDQISDIQRQLTEECADTDNLKSRVITLTDRQKKLDDEKSLLEAKKKYLDQQKKEMKKIEREKEEAEKKAAQAQEAVEKVKREMQELQRKMKAKLEEENRQKAKEKEEAARVRKERDALSTQLSTIENDLKKANDKCAHLSERREFYKKKYIKASDELEAFQTLTESSAGDGDPNQKKKKKSFLGIKFR